MKIDYAGKKYIMNWKHVRIVEDATLESKVVTPRGGKTICYIYELGEDKTKFLISCGTATCSNKDVYNKAIGRKLSIASAFEGTFTRTFREYVWNTYRMFHK
jgi:hypothetical protein